MRELQMATMSPHRYSTQTIWESYAYMEKVSKRALLCILQPYTTNKILMLKDIPAIPTSQVYRKIQNAY